MLDRDTYEIYSNSGTLVGYLELVNRTIGFVFEPKKNVPFAYTAGVLQDIATKLNELNHEKKNQS